ncbi:MAG: hypothetical protein LBU66_03515 [Treponema sp.]|jgi:hypothetical protein|nr:hypothetical protein [Treponema sp.]
MKSRNSVYSESSTYAFIKSITVPSLRPTFIKCIYLILYNFFFRQHRAAFLPGRIPVSDVDHPLDEKIPFVPSWVVIYFDFIHLWIRMLSFFLRRYGRKFFKLAGEFIVSIGKLYAFAAEVYQKNLSTTKRPFYIKNLKFFIIHLNDPHLMCVPSLHVMVVIHTYTKFAEYAKKMGERDNLIEQFLEVKYGAQFITQAILFIKQHSVNCIPAALYAMTCYTPDLFPLEEAENFTQLLFTPLPENCKAPKGSVVHPASAPKTALPKEDQDEIKAHILKLYRKFLEEGKTAKNWNDPLLNFLASYR